MIIVEKDNIMNKQYNYPSILWRLWGLKKLMNRENKIDMKEKTKIFTIHFPYIKTLKRDAITIDKIQSVNDVFTQKKQSCIWKMNRRVFLNHINYDVIFNIGMRRNQLKIYGESS